MNIKQQQADNIDKVVSTMISAVIADDKAADANKALAAGSGSRQAAAAADKQSGSSRQQAAAADNKAAAFNNLVFARQAVESAAYRPPLSWTSEAAAAAAAEWDFNRIAAESWLERAEIVFKAAEKWEKTVNVL